VILVEVILYMDIRLRGQSWYLNSQKTSGCCELATNPAWFYLSFSTTECSRSKSSAFGRSVPLMKMCTRISMPKRWESDKTFNQRFYPTPYPPPQKNTGAL